MAERKMSDSTEQEDIIDWPIAYRTSGSYPRLLSKDQKRAVWRRALTIEVDNGEVYVQKQMKRVKGIASREEQVRILNSCHSDATSGHLGTRKTRRKIAERFYWKGLSYEVKNLWPLAMFTRGWTEILFSKACTFSKRIHSLSLYYLHSRSIDRIAFAADPFKCIVVRL